MANRIPTATDQTNCEHDVREVWGVNRCVTCHRMFEEVDGVMVVEPVRLPPGPSECALMDDSEWDAMGKIEQVAAMIPALEENASTKGVARKLRAILGVS